MLVVAYILNMNEPHYMFIFFVKMNIISYPKTSNVHVFVHVVTCGHVATYSHIITFPITKLQWNIQTNTEVHLSWALEKTNDFHCW